VCSVSFYSCKKDVTPIEMHYGYFGLTPGRYIIYDVTEIRHDVDGQFQHDTSYYQLKTFIGPEYVDNLGRIAREYHRYTRNNSSDNWVFKDLWTTIIDDYKAELVDENQREVKLVFAPTLQKEWNPNMFNYADEMTSYYQKIHKSKKVGNLTYDSTLIVEQEDFQSLIDHKRKFEIYAKHVGLVYKYYKDLRIDNFDSLDVQKGNELFYSCIEYGFE
jgi:hypothetical protein